MNENKTNEISPDLMAQAAAFEAGRRSAIKAIAGRFAAMGEKQLADRILTAAWSQRALSDSEELTKIAKEIGLY